MGWFSFLTDPDPGLALRHEDGVGHRQIRRGVAVEDVLALDRTHAHLRGRSLRPLDKNSVNACATTAEIVDPLSRACARTRSASAAGSLTVNTTLVSGTVTRPDEAA
jgi:hypothetical protein